MLAALEAWGVLGIGQMIGVGLAGGLDETALVERFFNRMDRDDYDLGVAARLRALEDSGYIQGHSFLRQPKAFTLSHKGFEALSEEPRQARSEVRGEVSEALIRHDLKVSAVGLVLAQILALPARREHPQVVWSASEGRRRLTLEGVSDVWIDAQPPRAVEVELTQKSRGRYAEIFENYRRRLPRGGAVVYLAGWPGGVDMILRNAREQRAPFVFAGALDEFARTAGRAAFQGAVEGRTMGMLEDCVPAAAR